MGYNAMTESQIHEAILDAAKKSFFSKGIRNTEMRQLAKDVGISRSTLYIYYPQKSALAFTIANDLMLRRSDDIYRKVMSAECENSYERICLLFDTYVEFFLENTSFVKFICEFDIIYSDSYPDIDEARDYSESHARTDDRLVRIVEEGQRDGNIRSDIPARMIALACTNTIWGIAQRLLPREAIVEHEHGAPVPEIIITVLNFLKQSIKA